MKALLVQRNLERALEGALEGKSKMLATLSPNEKNMMDLTDVDIEISNDDQALLLLSTLSESYDGLVVTMLYGRTSIILGRRQCDVKLKKVAEEGSLDALSRKYRIQDEVMKVSKDALVLMIRMLLEGLYVLQSKIRSSSSVEWTVEEKYLDVLEHGRVNQCKECTMVGKCLKSLLRRYVTFNKAALTKQCKIASQVKVEPCSKATSWKKVEFEDSRSPVSHHVMMEDIQTRSSDGRQHFLWCSSRIRDRQGKQSKLVKKYRLGELVVL
ncbi:hypothetical protein CRG98_024815 [Punica granatum]|uniref:Uncharacterized protein n=1 Tax=Punica granatum TaxID=22663 RepID=A0A2I0JEX5_PUNGR|nr:hypothetical protein CRG98_024815 [Punica granatum]